MYVTFFHGNIRNRDPSYAFGEIKVHRRISNRSCGKNFYYFNISLERKWVREDPSVGGNVENRIVHRIHIVATYAWVLSDTFSNGIFKMITDSYIPSV